ncbi:helix-turn-helix transcriptional regulator [Labilithrix luteola]|uniref:helix-turn-helix transcriptional regulator n=1 Tax=Labilithrix luteola TaxID=1391654 RepID=UPI0011BA8F85|nr:LuxR family transcriptional regulator [Labilithrix luteola]
MTRESRRTQRLHSALAEFYGPGLAADTFVDRAFTLTARLVPFALNSHGVIDRKTGSLTAAFDCTPPGLADAFAAFGRLMGKYAPFRFDPTVNDGKPFSARDFYSRPAFCDLDIYQEVYRPMRLTDHCFMHVPTGPDEVVFVGFLRDGRPFDLAEKELFQLVQPHLSNGRKLAFAMTAAEDTPVTPELFFGAGFTPRESDVLYWLTRGKTNEEIAKLLRMRADSVSRHLQTIYEKMGVEHRVSATIRALDLARKLHAAAVSLQGGEVSFTVPTR